MLVDDDDNDNGSGDTQFSRYYCQPTKSDDGAGVIVADSLLLMANGNYLFEDVTPGDYVLLKINDTNFVDV